MLTPGREHGRDDDDFFRLLAGGLVKNIVQCRGAEFVEPDETLDAREFMQFTSNLEGRGMIGVIFRGAFHGDDLALEVFLAFLFIFSQRSPTKLGSIMEDMNSP